MKKLGFIFLAMLFAGGSSHAEIDAEKIYFGGGLGINSLSGFDNGLGFQLFAGYPLPVELANGLLSVELGYMDSGNMEHQQVVNFGFGTYAYTVETRAKGLWVNAVYSLPLENAFGIVGRAGLDLGDDDGVMLGGGVGFQASDTTEIRIEYVMRDHIDSLQLNLVIRQ